MSENVEVIREAADQVAIALHERRPLRGESPGPGASGGALAADHPCPGR